MVDLSNVKIGDTLKLRCGGTVVVDYITSRIWSGVHQWFDDGTFNKSGSSPFDVIEVIPAPEPVKVVFSDWANIYADGFGGHYCTKEIAEAWKNDPRIALVHHTYTIINGKLDKVESEIV